MGLPPVRAAQHATVAAAAPAAQPPDKPGWAVTAVGVSHCGAGCTLGDIVAEFAVFGLAATLAGEALFAEYLGDYLAAVSLGIVFTSSFPTPISISIRTVPCTGFSCSSA